MTIITCLSVLCLLSFSLCKIMLYVQTLFYTRQATKKIKRVVEIKISKSSNKKNLWLKQWPCHQSQVECFIKTQADWHFSSPELKSEVSFSDHNLPVVHLTVRLSENFFTFLHLRTPPFLREDHMRNFQKSSQEPFYRESWNSCGNILG